MTDPSSSQCLFRQTFDALKAHRIDEYRCNTFSNYKMFDVNFYDEEGIDAGGLFRYSVTLPLPVAVLTLRWFASPTYQVR